MQAIHSTFPKLTFRQGLSSGNKAYLPPVPTEILWMTAEFYASTATFGIAIEQPTEAHTAFFSRVDWVNTGPATAGPARPVPFFFFCLTALHLVDHYQFTNLQ